MPGPAPSLYSPFRRCGNADREFHDFEAALNVALGVGNGLAVLAGEKFGKRLIFLLGKLQEFHQHADAFLRVLRRPPG